MYDSFKSPRYYEIKSTFAKFLLILLPSLTILSILVSCFFFFYLKSLKSSLAKQEPKIISQLREESFQKNEIINNLKRTQQELQQKLESPVNLQLTSLNLFKPVTGRADLTKNSVLSISNTQVKIKNQKLYFTFDLVNTTQNNKRLSGYLFVIYRNNRTLQFYPDKSFSKNAMDLAFNNGEFFSTARFRATETVFSMPKEIITNLKGQFRILIFSKSGDLLHEEIIIKENIK